MIEFNTQPEQYQHWSLEFDGPVATLKLGVNEDGGLLPGYKLKLNSYDLGVDIELHDAVQRLRFENPEIRTVVITSAMEKVFCAGANIRMLGLSTHAHKVNFCKFTNETRNSIEDATSFSGQTYISAINGTAAGGGYELALATDYIILVDDSSSAISLPEVPLLAVLPGTGGLTRVVDKRKVRRDHADYFCTVTEGIRGKRAVKWKLIDELIPRSKFTEKVKERALEFAEKSSRPENEKGIVLAPLNRKIEEERIIYDHLSIEFERQSGIVNLTVHAPEGDLPSTPENIQAAGANYWPLAMARELDDAIMHLSFNELELGTWVLRSKGDADQVFAVDQTLIKHQEHWLVREIMLNLKRVFKRLDLVARSLVALIEPGSCFTGTLLELVLAADRSYMLDGTIEDTDEVPAMLRPTEMNFGALPMCNDLTRLQTRFIDDAENVENVRNEIANNLDAAAADELGLVTFIPDDIDWEDEVRIAVEERASFSPDALTGMEASLRFAGPETLETKIFGRLTAWQNWIFQRPNAVGEEGALKLYGSGKQSNYDKKRV
ncbi:2,3-epoxybenzoyl-CoA dihydrolase [bacterium]|jgi:benzoyl-CoA-dihydrodiol lyase|nr:benzoyl-CoA-dihydrodiol lyase [Deltaproteobacteria bacterium]MDB3917251.1 2,3-epoxybenzoyl-CoA dihydrolase [bacterium]